MAGDHSSVAGFGRCELRRTFEAPAGQKHATNRLPAEGTQMKKSRTFPSRIALTAASCAFAACVAAAQPDESALTIYSSQQPGAISADFYRPVPGGAVPPGRFGAGLRAGSPGSRRAADLGPLEPALHGRRGAHRSDHGELSRARESGRARARAEFPVRPGQHAQAPAALSRPDRSPWSATSATRPSTVTGHAAVGRRRSGAARDAMAPCTR